MPDPINPDVTRPPQSQPVEGPDRQSIGANDDPGRDFSLPKGQEVDPQQGAQQGENVSLFDLAGQGDKKGAMPVEEMQSSLQGINDNLEKVKGQISNPEQVKGITPTHEQAFNRVMDKMNPDMKTIADSTGGEFKPPEKAEDEGVLGHVMNWINGSQNTLQGALGHLSNMEKPDLGTYMKLQYSVQRASQRGELFASIVGSSVSGIKTIMSTQLG